MPSWTRGAVSQANHPMAAMFDALGMARFTRAQGFRAALAAIAQRRPQRPTGPPDGLGLRDPAQVAERRSRPSSRTDTASNCQGGQGVHWCLVCTHPLAKPVVNAWKPVPRPHDQGPAASLHAAFQRPSHRRELCDRSACPYAPPTGCNATRRSCQAWPAGLPS